MEKRFVEQIDFQTTIVLKLKQLIAICCPIYYT